MENIHQTIKSLLSTILDKYLQILEDLLNRTACCSTSVSINMKLTPCESYSRETCRTVYKLQIDGRLNNNCSRSLEIYNFDAISAVLKSERLHVDLSTFKLNQCFIPRQISNEKIAPNEPYQRTL